MTGVAVDWPAALYAPAGCDVARGDGGGKSTLWPKLPPVGVVDPRCLCGEYLAWPGHQHQRGRGEMSTWGAAASQ